ncbi:DUF3224 domain-containing protein [Streptomyces rapamycinicus]|uniref:DUF3224 domain-containing protein n=3 Tax=Streptomyces rapamycinicus TaxID=1226757 RepID=A0A0A0NL24_STRRN|nr:DUF3224 domain-containing protein [Streptomyces rapamycinicus]AGP60272.1 hypothetical protein M271_44520 [Streptomyces rapamycinicus NRRL 5491]MBB4788565.1 hypothetical protein [Streptomyces rapamycinicus]RLV72897.1 hypothetical protein D3C57_150260 [Streptomyces rapamycinicus NRRL 5491]UTP35853.1 DUF3224 domain-containing protein [Streptomyces rapamycinicus NRRL 5491]
MTTHTTGHFTYADWQETALDETEGGEGGEGRAKLARAVVTNAFSGGIEAPRTSCQYAITYRADKTGVCCGYELLTGTLDGRAGSFVVVQHGSWGEDATVRCTFEMVPGSGTGELTGLTGSGAFSAVRGESEIPYSFDYTL